MDDYAVQVHELTKRFGDFIAVDSVTFDVHRGEIFGFLGPNGAGKTTTIRMLLGLLRPSAGRASVLGYDIVQQPEPIRRHVGYMSQHFSLYEDLTVMENLTFYGRTYGVRGQRLRARRCFALQMAGLEGQERELTRNLAGGWKQRLALGAAILHEPDILFLDEPTAGVDPISRRDFWDMLYDLAEAGTTIFVTTHYMDEAERCHGLGFLYQGRLIAKGSPEELKQAHMWGEVLEIECDHPGRAIKLLREQGSFREVAMYGSLIHAVSDEANERRSETRRLLAESGVVVESMDVIAPSLEDVFISIVQQTKAEAEQASGPHMERGDT